MTTVKCGLIYTSAEFVGLGMDVLDHELCTLCRIWGWLIRALYACYFGARFAQYWYFLGHHDSSAAITHEIFQDAIFLTALALNHLVNLKAKTIRRIACKVGRHDGPVAFFNTILNFMTFFAWGVAVFSTVFAHTTTMTTGRLDSASPPLREGLQISSVVLSHYVRGILVFGTVVFSAILFIYLEYALCMRLLQYRKQIKNAMTHKNRSPLVVQMVLKDYYTTQALIRDLEASFRGPLLVLFAAGTLYILDCVAQWSLTEDGFGAQLPSTLRAGMVASFLFFCSDLGDRLRRRLTNIAHDMKSGVDSVKDTDREVLETCNSFYIDCFSEPASMKLVRNCYLGNLWFAGWTVATTLLSAVIGITCYYAK